jgi:hypothetical protein
MAHVESFYRRLQIMARHSTGQPQSTQFMGTVFITPPHQDGHHGGLNHYPPRGFRFREASSEDGSRFLAGQTQADHQYHLQRASSSRQKSTYLVVITGKKITCKN